MARKKTQNNEEVLHRSVKRCRERGILIPTFTQMRHPERIPVAIQEKIKGVGLWDIDPLNLFRISWKNDLSTGGFSGPNFLEIPQEITGVRARIFGMIGKYFPTGAHKVGAAFACLVPRLVSGQFDPERHKAVWPSTGNYCRGGAFDSAILGCTAVAILPENMSRERFDWLNKIGAEVIKTPGGESNVKEIYDKCHELQKDPVNWIFNQFAELGNPLWHYHVTGPAIEEAFFSLPGEKKRFSAFVSATGSAGTIGAGDYLKSRFPASKVVACEALQCPTLLMNGFGDHRIEGIGDKHIPWVHNVRNTDAISAIDDEDCMRILRLFNEELGKDFLRQSHVPEPVIEKLSLLGISGICNLLSAIKAVKHWELGENDVIATVFTDSAEMYQSRLAESSDCHGGLTMLDAAKAYCGSLEKQTVAHFKELTHPEKKAVHNLKYFTWVEQQGKEAVELCAQWDPEYWLELWDEVEQYDRLIDAFNQEIGKGQ